MSRFAGIRRWAGFALLALCVAHARAELPAAVAQALKQAGIPETHVGIVVREIGNPVPLLAQGEQRGFNPASVMKLLTMLVALDSLGPAHTFQTRIYGDGPLQGGVLQGNLILQGGGDPALTMERFWLLLRELRERGIREIRGDVLLDNRFYQLDPIDPGAFDQAPLRPYNAPPAALLVNFNTLNLRLSAMPGAQLNKVSIRLDPMPSQLRLENSLQAVDTPCQGWREQVKTLLTEGVLVVSGSYPLACGEQVITLNLLSPEATVAAFFDTFWRELGGVQVGKIRALDASATVENLPRLLLTFDSLPLSQLVRDINKYSNNVMAKMLFLNLGAAQFGAPANWDKGEQALRGWLKQRGIEMPELVLQNGSGLSRIERISAHSLATLLDDVSSRAIFHEFAASLPAIGLEGTQAGRMQGTAMVGQAWLKSGTLNQARNIAGYVLASNGRRRILVMLINHANAAAGTNAQAALLEWAMK